MVRTITAIAKPIITSADIVDALVGIRDELAGGIAPVFVIPRIWELVGRIEADAATAAEQIAMSLPRLCGGAPDPSDFEELCPEFLADPEGWPDHFDYECDAVFYDLAPDHDGPLPLSVLAETAPAWEPRDEDWSEMKAWAESLWTDADQVAAHGHA